MTTKICAPPCPEQNPPNTGKERGRIDKNGMEYSAGSTKIRKLEKRLLHFLGKSV
ncbi:hypothetical protein [Pseudoflavonifractor sp. AF19-9AC]|uniref:hypothetical protein n=1 Tax=Pseudoflavonifractor sp. AF19-9AC TaxID=2292244 RepID=UPI0018F6136D|nr:hypothetical protein [Pseudoflavonifractor sp. AF19-9AC]